MDLALSDGVLVEWRASAWNLAYGYQYVETDVFRPQRLDKEMVS